VAGPWFHSTKSGRRTAGPSILANLTEEVSRKQTSPLMQQPSQVEETGIRIIIKINQNVTADIWVPVIAPHTLFDVKLEKKR
jgi:hypothetical protein